MSVEKVILVVTISGFLVNERCSLKICLMMQAIEASLPVHPETPGRSSAEVSNVHHHPDGQKA